MKATLCEKCNATLTCSASLRCWCNSYPKLISPEETRSCLCENCLLNHLAKKVNKQGTILSEKDKKTIIALGEVIRPKEGNDYYLENGLLVMTKWFLLRRGYCCENGCRYCPY